MLEVILFIENPSRAAKVSECKTKWNTACLDNEWLEGQPRNREWHCHLKMYTVKCALKCFKMGYFLILATGNKNDGTACQ